MDYQEFIYKKSDNNRFYGFKPTFMPDYLMDFQKYIVDWAVNKGRAAIFADCGLGKTPMQLVWAKNIVKKTKGKVLIVVPLAVIEQTISEGQKFGIKVTKSLDGKPKGRITITNYEKLHFFDPDDWDGFVGDESSILKNFDGVIKSTVTSFCRKMKYRLLCTATAAPNDYTELGTSSEALGYLGYTDMLSRFFKNDQNSIDTGRFHGKSTKWRFKGYAEQEFWRWVGSWAIILRKPSDLGFQDGDFILPKLNENEIVTPFRSSIQTGFFTFPAKTLQEQRKEQRESLEERCKKAVKLVDHEDPVVVWCQLNDEGDFLERNIPGAKQVKGNMDDDKKVELFRAFRNGELRVLITKAKIGGFGLNWQHCNHTVYFPSYSYEQYYQSIRRIWRFGQTRNVRVDIVTTEGGLEMLKSIKEKSMKADKMLDSIIGNMGKPFHMYNEEKRQEVKFPSWL